MIGWALQRAHLFLLRHTVQPLPLALALALALALPSAIHCRTATTPALTVTLSANASLGSALGVSGLVGWVVYYKIKYTMGVYIFPLQSMLKDACSF